MNPAQSLEASIAALEWYHTIDLGGGIVTPGYYDHRPYLGHYGLPDDLRGKRVLDVGAASGFFSFELERRGGAVTATDLRGWFDHDFSPIYRPDKTVETGSAYLHEPFDVAKRALHSHVDRKLLRIYDISPDTGQRHHRHRHRR
jgi:tRNA (mo5U34)-methyltransferase